MKVFPTDEHTPSQACARYADDIALLDEMDEPEETESPERIAARAHLATCERCQRERQATLATTTALRRHVVALMAQAPHFSESAIARQAQEGARTQSNTQRGASVRTPGQLRDASARIRPALGAATPPSLWRRAISTWGSAAALALITALLVAALTGHLQGRLAGARHDQPAPNTASAPLSALRVYAPAPAMTADNPSGLVAYRASDGAPEPAAPVTPVAQSGALIAQGVRYQLNPPSDNGADPSAILPSIFSATRLSDGHSLWSERIDAVWSPDLSLVDGVLYLSTFMGAGGAYQAGVDTHLRAVYAFRATDGSRLWKHTLTAAPVGPPVVAQDVVYVVAGGKALALRASDGATLWQAPLETDARQIITAWPTVADGMLYIYVSLTSPSGQKDDFGADIFALRLSDGALVWHVTLGTELFPVLGSFAPVVADSVVYVRLASATLTSPDITLRLIALRATDGALLWRYTSNRSVTDDVGLPNIYPPTVSQGTVYVSEDGGYLTALRARDGGILWNENIDTTPANDSYPNSVSSPVFMDGVVFTIMDAQIVAVRASDGAVLWRVACAAERGEENYPPVIGR